MFTSFMNRSLFSLQSQAVALSTKEENSVEQSKENIAHDLTESDSQTTNTCKSSLKFTAWRKNYGKCALNGEEKTFLNYGNNSSSDPELGGEDDNDEDDYYDYNDYGILK